MRKLGIIAIVLTMVVIGAVSILKWMQLGPFAPKDEKQAEKSKIEQPSHTDMDMLVIPVFGGDKVAITYYVQLKLETLGLKNQAAVRKILPRLHNAFLVDLHDYIPRTLKLKSKLEATGIRDRLKTVGDKELGPGIISNILIQSIIDKAE